MGNSCSRVSTNAKSESPAPESPEVKEIVNVESKLPTIPMIEFTFDQLKKITHNFTCHLGGGGYGDVYKGVILEDQKKGQRPLRVAVKVHDSRNSLQGDKEWLAEVNILGQLSHPNLVKLIGYCCKDNHQILVYEFMCRGSVESNLYAKRLAPLPWATRMKIAHGAAKGLAFLHEAQIIYRDVKTSNILLDWEYNVKLSDFGLAKDGPVGDQTHISTQVMGTYGYADPEYMRTGHLSASSDVYSFGVVLLELVTGRKSLEKNNKAPDQSIKKKAPDMVLAEWAPPLVKNTRKFPSIVDPRLDGDYSITSVRKAASLACHCLNQDPKARPLMRDVVNTLEPLQIRAEEFEHW